MVGHFTFRHSLRVVLAMGWSDFVLKYRGSVFGYLWSLAAPLVKFLVILYVFGPFVQEDIPLYPLYLFLGIILWEHFTHTTTDCMAMLHDKKSIIQKIRFPRVLLIFSVGWTNAIVFLTHFCIFLVFAAVLGVPFFWMRLYTLLIFLQMTFLALGVGMFLASYSLKFKDIPHLWNVLAQVLFWLTPIMYPYPADRPFFQALLQVPGLIRDISLMRFFDLFVRFQPLSILIHDARRAMIFPFENIPSVLHALWFTGFCVLLFLAGTLLFVRRSKFFLQEY